MKNSKNQGINVLKNSKSQGIQVPLKPLPDFLSRDEI